MENISNMFQFLIDYIAQIGLFGGFFVIVLESIISIIPLAIFIGINVYNFGHVVGFIMSYVATILGCLLSFSLFRYVIRNKLKVIEKEQVKHYMEKLKNIKLANLVLIIALPFTPAFVVNIAAGLSNIDFKKYTIALLIGKLSTIYFWGYIGTSLIESVTNPIILIKIFVILLVSYLVCKLIQKIFNIKEN